MYPWFTSLHTKLLHNAAEQRLHHALLIAAKPGMGKHDFVQQLASDLLCHQPLVSGACGQCQSCHLNVAHSHPDRYHVVSEKQISVTDIRSALSKLLEHAQLGQRKVLIIENADTMTESAANALLKTLEEPTQHTYILLTVNAIERLLPTILSRCEKNTVAMPHPQLINDWLMEQHNVSAAHDFIRAYQYAPLSIAHALVNAPDSNFLSFKQDLLAVKQQQMNTIQFGNKWHATAYQCLGWLQLLLHSKMQKATEADAKAKCMHNYQVVLHEMQRVHHQGTNKRLVLSHVIDKVMR